MASSVIGSMSTCSLSGAAARVRFLTTDRVADAGDVASPPRGVWVLLCRRSLSSRCRLDVDVVVVVFRCGSASARDRDTGSSCRPPLERR